MVEQAEIEIEEVLFVTVQEELMDIVTRLNIDLDQFPDRAILLVRCEKGIAESNERLISLMTPQPVTFVREVILEHIEKCMHCLLRALQTVFQTARKQRAEYFGLTRRIIPLLKGAPPFKKYDNHIWAMQRIRESVPGIMKALAELEKIQMLHVCTNNTLGAAIRAVSKQDSERHAHLGSGKIHAYLLGSEIPIQKRRAAFNVLLKHSQSCASCNAQYAFDDLFDLRLSQAITETYTERRNRMKPK